MSLKQRGPDENQFYYYSQRHEMSISENVGGLSTYLSNLRTADAYTGLKARLEKSLNRIPVYGSGGWWSESG